MAETTNLKKNYLLNTANQLLSLIVPLITAPYLSRVLTSDGIGIQSYTNSIVTYFTLIAVMGSSSFGQRQIAYDRDNRREMSEAFWNIMGFRFITTCVTFVAYILFVFNVKQYNVYYWIWSLQVVNVVLDITWFFQGIEEFRKIVTRSVLVRLSHALSIFLFIKKADDLWLYILLTCGFNTLGYLVMWAYLPRYIDKPRRVHPLANCKDIFLLFLPTIATQVYVMLDKSMIGWITTSTYQNGCYEQAEKIARISLTVVTSISTVVLPRIASLFKKNELDSAKEILYNGYRFVLLLSIPMTFGLLAVADTFVPVFFGAGYEMAIPLLHIFSFIIIPISLAHITGYSYLIPTGQQNVYTASVTVAAVANLLMNLLLIPRIGAIGAAIGSVTAEVTGILIQLFYCFAKKQLQAKRVFHDSWHYVISAVAMAVIIQLESLLMSENLISLLCKVTSGAAVYFILLLLLKDKFFYNNLAKLFNMLNRKVRK